MSKSLFNMIFNQPGGDCYMIERGWQRMAGYKSLNLPHYLVMMCASGLNQPARITWADKHGDGMLMASAQWTRDGWVTGEFDENAYGGYNSDYKRDAAYQSVSSNKIIKKSFMMLCLRAPFPVTTDHSFVACFL